MKKKFILRSKFQILIIYFIIYIECRKKRITPDNTLSPYPYPNEAPTSLEQLNVPNPGPPPLSSSLEELDSSQGITRQVFMSTIKYIFYQINRSQMEMIFNFIDANHNDIVERDELNLFIQLYVLPFEACLQWRAKDDQNNAADSHSTDQPNTESHHYKLNLDQFKTCFEADPKSKSIIFREMDQKRNPFQIIKNIISLESSPGINFYQYLFTRKAMFGWYKCCSSADHIGKNHFDCALGHIIPSKALLKLQRESIYDIGLKYQFNEYSRIQLDFISYIRIVYYANIFSIFELKNNFSSLDKGDFIKAIREDRESNEIREEDVDYLYSIFNDEALKNKGQINFETFCFFLHFHKLFDRYSKEMPMQLSLQEFLSLLNDDETPIKIVMSIDSSFTNFEEMHYQQASLILQTLRPNETKFFYSFRAKHKSISKHKKELNEETPEKILKKITGVYWDYLSIRNETNRERFFSIYSDSIYMTRIQYLTAFQFSNFFTEFCVMTQVGTTKDIRQFFSTLGVQNLLVKLEDSFQITTPMISPVQRKARDYLKFLPENISLDILTFLSLMNFEHKIQISLGSTDNLLISELNLKNILQSLGMENMPDTVIAISQKNYDQLNKRMFQINDVIKNVFIVHAVAVEHMRNTYRIIINNLKLTEEISRRFPLPNRRHQSSPFV